MNATQLRTQIQLRFKVAKANIALFGENDSHDYWNGYKQALIDLMADDVIHAYKKEELTNA